ncbi:MAG: family 10 glycosylhydrolase [Paludibacter sp.]|nr:family 10 glycosylhydrolase [Bacteroidales bacterium]MCM1068612.1 family 10 glycosylhydrolase [Prevotella sp.]MCM1353276.1 family 10 glycosylhydrolase [Bacteroides sp.]MCM1442316.1 family 10 glycosylhydrolase [Muribaculum sp.]MCM1481135.1 family 10 glycosylhydrolase [Paludibacter sp.]
MKKIYFLLLFAMLAIFCFATGPKRDFRAAWVATVWGIDWPKSTNMVSQKAEMDNILNRAKEGNMTAVMLQVRSNVDALYRSSYDPWNSVLTGTRGKDPGWDPLQYAIEQAHARGLELHVWINPYRCGTYTVRASQIKDSWVLPAGILDPGNPEVRQYTMDVINEIIDNYDIDGIIFDDYFYKSMTSNAYVTNETRQTPENNPHNLSIDDWRRENVNLLVKAVMESVKQRKPYLRFGIGPFGVWSMTGHNVYDEDYTTYDSVAGSTGSTDAYATMYCDAATWLKRGYIDYISPQLYWPMQTSSAGYVSSCPYDRMFLWWADLAKRYNRHFYVSQDVADNNSNGSTNKRYNSPEEIEAQMRFARTNGNGQGHIFYNTQYLFNLNGVNSKYFSTAEESYHTFLTQNWFADKSLAPSIDWREAPKLKAPSSLRLSGNVLSWEHPDAPRFSVYAYPKGMNTDFALEDASYLLGVTYSHSFNLGELADLEDKTIAVCAYDRYGNEYAPALYNEGNSTLLNGDVSMVPLWNRTSATVDYLTTAGSNRSIAYYDNELYIPDVAAGSFAVINARTGEWKTTHTIADGAFWQHNLRITTDGQMLLGNSVTASASFTLKTSSRTQGGADDLSVLALTGLGRTDYFFPYGEWERNGFLLALSNTGNLLKIPFVDGTLGKETLLSNAALPAGTSAKAIPADANTFYASIAGKLPTKHAIATGNLLESFDASVAPAAVNASGMAVFSLQGHTYMVLPHDVFGSFEVYEVTYGLNKAKKVIDATTPLGTTANTGYTVDFCTEISGNDAYIYVLAPNNGVAAYRFTFTPGNVAVPDEIEQDHVLISPTLDGFEVVFEGTKAVEVYTVNGLLIDRQMATDYYTHSLPQGLYIVRVGNAVHKFVK